MKISDIQIDEGFRGLVTPLSNQEFQALRKSMRETNGNVVAILLRKDNTVYDGHHRLQVCQVDNYEPKVEICSLRVSKQGPRNIIRYRLQSE